MKKLSIFIFTALLALSGFAQQGSTFMCSYYGEPVSVPLRVVNSSEDARRAIAGVMDVVGLNSNFEVKQAAIPNAAAIILNNKRYILYNPSFINRINNAAGDKWAAIAILAHEIGHHLDGHTLAGTGSHPETELEADEFSGFVLRKMGATLEQAQSAMQLLASERASATHPAKFNRLVSIDNGWTKADAQMTGRSYTAKTSVPPTPAESRVIRTSSPIPAVNYVLNPAQVNFKLYFDQNPAKTYYITKDNRFVTINNGNAVVIGSMVRSQYRDYPLALKLNDDNYFFLSRTGDVVNAKGNKVGIVKG